MPWHVAILEEDWAQ